MKTPFSRVFCFVLALLLLLPMSVLEFAVPVRAAYENTHQNTGDQRADIIGVALTQVGYREESNGYTKYGAWYGSSRMAWCGAFISWCANQANIPTSIIRKNGYASPSDFGLTDVFYYSSGRTPQAGDLFFRIDSDGAFAHAGIVYYVQGNYFYTLEGNTHDGSYVDGVYIRQRGLTGTYCFARPNYRNTSGHTHSYTTASEVAHPHKEYKYCSGCNDKYYTGNNKIQSDCITCKQENCTHNYGSYTKTDNTYHKATCSLCDKVESSKHTWTNEEITKEPTCKETGLKAQSCKQCGFSQEVTLPVTQEHTYTQWLYADGESHHMVCQVCEKEETEAHISGETLYSDDRSHWKTCEDCGGQLHREEHVFSGNCEAACEVCGYRSSVGHVYSTNWQTDDQAHWYVCLKCDAVKEWQSHTYSGVCDATCDICDDTRTTHHTYDASWRTDSSGHWKTCKDCHENSPVQPHKSTSEATEGKAVYCADCGYEIAAAVSHVHSYVVTSHDRQGHYGACTCGETIVENLHVWNFQTETCRYCQEPIPTVENQSVVIRLVVNQVGVSPYLWLIFVMPVVALLAILLLALLLILAIRKRSRNIDDDDYDDYHDDDDDDYEDDGDDEIREPVMQPVVTPEVPVEPELSQEPEIGEEVPSTDSEESAMEPLSV